MPVEASVMKRPVVFLSHASSDNEFVRKLDDRLTARGLEVINDERSFAMGDNLVEDIFDQGISRADGCVLILSADSVQRPWPRAELNAAVVESIERGMKLIPILLDDIKVPPPLRPLVFYKVGDRNSEDEIDRIAISSGVISS
jgi:TIR domain